MPREAAPHPRAAFSKRLPPPEAEQTGADRTDSYQCRTPISRQLCASPPVDPPTESYGLRAAIGRKWALRLPAIETRPRAGRLSQPAGFASAKRQAWNET